MPGALPRGLLDQQQPPGLLDLAQGLLDQPSVVDQMMAAHNRYRDVATTQGWGAAMRDPVSSQMGADIAGQFDFTGPAGGLLGAIKAYHGSPHTFDKFSMGNIGTGEGAQAYGHGLYMAEAPEVAEMYRRKLSYPKIDNPTTPAERAADDINYHNGNEDTALSAWKSDVAKYPESPAGKSAAEKLAAWESGEVAKLGSSGSLYHVNLDVNHEDLLDWDKPLSEQSPKVREALADFAKPPGARRPEPTGEQIVDQLKSSLDVEGNDAAAASAALQRRGIPGIRYLDGSSRGAGEGSRNIVMFDDAPISILERNGQPVQPR